MPASEALKRAVRKYEKENIRQIKFNLSLKYDRDVIEKLDSVQNKQGYIKSLIRADIARANSGKKEEEQKMKTWWIIDRRDGDEWTENTGTSDMATARNLAFRQWDALSDHDRKHRQEFYIALGEKDEDGLLDWNSVMDTVDIMSAKTRTYHIKPDYLSQWGEECTEDTVITQDELERLAAEWDEPVGELLEQLEEI